MQDRQCDHGWPRTSDADMMRGLMDYAAGYADGQADKEAGD
jgi:hypothetical protein